MELTLVELEVLKPNGSLLIINSLYKNNNNNMAGSFQGRRPVTQRAARTDQAGLETSEGLTLIPWSEGPLTTWDVTVTNIVAMCCLPVSSTDAAETAAQHEETKLAEISETYIFFPLAFETMKPNLLRRARLNLGSRSSDFRRHR
jgi:hypothetical protein